mgnify:CR=1 FL=1
MKHTKIFDGIINYLKANQDDIEVVLECEMQDITNCLPLIATAHELLEACQMAYEHSIDRTELDLIDQECLKQVITKAKGED